MDLSNLSTKFYKALDAINKLSDYEKNTLTTLLVTVNHNNPNSETTSKASKTIPEDVPTPKIVVMDGYRFHYNLTNE